jgi:hypothetical protein
LLVFGNNRGFFVKKVTFSGPNQRVQVGASAAVPERLRLNQQFNEKEPEH